ncbi:MAG TPA: M13 family metallopeptidase [Kofleriaceae bacterium]|nr:M13 family metallopeptidase [Kofleriaceae bacterium]
MRLSILAVVAACASPPVTPAPVATPTVIDTGTGVAVGDLDRTVDPCADFYAYANGAWRAANPIPKGQSRWSRRAVSRDLNRRQVRELLGELAAETWPAGSTEQVVGDFFASCMDEAGVEATGMTRLGPLLAEIRAIRGAADLQRAIRRLHELNISVPFGTSGSFDNADPTRYLENIVAGGLGLADRDAYAKPQDGYRAHVANILMLGGASDKAARAGADQIFELETKLAAASLDPKSAADPVLTEHLMSVAQVAELAPRIDWSGYSADAKLATGVVNVTEPKFLAKVNEQLVETPLATWKLYLEWHLLDTAAPWLSATFVAEAFAGGEVPPRAARCAELTETLFPEAVGKKYVERYFSPAAKAKARAIATALLDVIEQDIPTLAWMAPQTKQRALAKISASRVEIGYPDHWKSYAGVTIRRDALWSNIMQGRKFAVDDDRRQVGKPTDRQSWRLPPSSPLAYIDLQINELVLPAGFLQAPVFDPRASDAVNFGAFGSGLAHDLMHAIDATGSIYAIDGKPAKWWSATDEADFAQRAACVRDEYAAYTIEPGIHEDGKLVLDEAIGDLGGLHVAFTALERAIKMHPVPALEGLTAEQQFFLAWGQLRGESIGIEAQRQMVKGDIHPVPALRVNGPLANLPEFAAAFACKVAEPGCAVW